MEETKLDLDEMAATFVESAPRLGEKEREISVALYRLLSRGEPVRPEGLAAKVAMPEEDVKRILKEWYGVFYNDQKFVVGYWGLGLPEMKHRFRVDGRALYTWCAWDSLFIPEILGKTVYVESTCPETGNDIRLTVSPEGVPQVIPRDAVMSYISPETSKLEENVVTNFCHYVHFFSSRQAGLSWISQNPGTLLMSIEEAFELGKKKNAKQYGSSLKE